MISEEMLRAAASDAGAALLESLHDEAPCAPPPRFERRMRRLIRRTEHPALYRTLRTAACFALAVLLGSSLVLAAIPKVRDSFFSWVRRNYRSNAIVYTLPAHKDAKVSEAIYRPTFIPTGYQETVSSDNKGSGLAVYESDDYLLSFNYTASAHGCSLQIILDDTAVYQTGQVGNLPADLYICKDDSSSSTIVWEDPATGVLFCISYWGDTDTLIRIAESVSEYTP